jgi:hypothetical protein
VTAGLRCDGPACPAFADSHAPWFFLARQGGVTDFIDHLFGAPPSGPLTFCSLKCVADYGYVQHVASGAATGAERPPLGGLGWPR